MSIDNTLLWGTLTMIGAFSVILYMLYDVWTMK